MARGKREERSETEEKERERAKEKGNRKTNIAKRRERETESNRRVKKKKGKRENGMERKRTNQNKTAFSLALFFLLRHCRATELATLLGPEWHVLVQGTPLNTPTSALTTAILSRWPIAERSAGLWGAKVLVENDARLPVWIFNAHLPYA